MWFTADLRSEEPRGLSASRYSTVQDGIRSYLAAKVGYCRATKANVRVAVTPQDTRVCRIAVLRTLYCFGDLIFFLRLPLFTVYSDPSRLHYFLFISLPLASISERALYDYHLSGWKKLKRHTLIVSDMLVAFTTTLSSSSTSAAFIRPISPLQ